MKAMKVVSALASLQTRSRKKFLRQASRPPSSAAQRGLAVARARWQLGHPAGRTTGMSLIDELLVLVLLGLTLPPRARGVAHACRPIINEYGHEDSITDLS
jgi:hypothetical protein